LEEGRSKKQEGIKPFYTSAYFDYPSTLQLHFGFASVQRLAQRNRSSWAKLKGNTSYLVRRWARG